MYEVVVKLKLKGRSRRQWRITKCGTSKEMPTDWGCREQRPTPGWYILHVGAVSHHRLDSYSLNEKKKRMLLEWSQFPNIQI